MYFNTHSISTPKHHKFSHLPSKHSCLQTLLLSLQLLVLLHCSCQTRLESVWPTHSLGHRARSLTAASASSSLFSSISSSAYAAAVYCCCCHATVAVSLASSWTRPSQALAVCRARPYPLSHGQAEGDRKGVMQLVFLHRIGAGLEGQMIKEWGRD